MNAYQRFAYYYDEIFNELDYTQWLKFIEPYLKQDSSILDLACGSGTLAILLKLKGYAVEGLDLSESIIEIAKEKAKMNRLTIPFYVGNMTHFALNQKYDIITCFFDSVNFLQSESDLNSLFDCIRFHLKENGLFIFDIFSRKLLEEYKNHRIMIKEKTHKIKWKTKKLGSSTLLHTILIREGWLTQKEHYYEYFHSLDDFSFSGFEIICLSGDFKESVSEENERILIVLKKTTAD